MPKTVTQTALVVAPTTDPVKPAAAAKPSASRKGVRKRGKGKRGGTKEHGAKTGRRFSPASRFRG